MAGLSAIIPEQTKENIQSVLEIARIFGDVLRDPAQARKNIDFLQSLNDEEQQKYQDARDLIEQHKEILDSNAKILQEHRESRIAFAAEQKKAQDAADAQAKEFGDRKASLQAQDQRLTAKETELTKKDRSLADKETTLAVTESALNARADKLQALEKSLADKEASIAVRENAVQAKQDKLREVIG